MTDLSGLETAEEFHARVAAATDDEGRLTVAVEEMPGWDIFPFEIESLRIKPLQPLAAEEPARRGEAPLLDWEENLPAVPLDVVRANAAYVAERLIARLGGSGPAWA